MKKTYKLIGTFFLFFISSPAFAQSTEQMTITSYYPSPFGVYDRLRLMPRGAAPSCLNKNDWGSIYYDEAQNSLLVCTDDGFSGGTWSANNVWKQVGDNIFPSQTAANPNIKVGIGTMTPSYNLEAGTAMLGQLGLNLPPSSDSSVLLHMGIPAGRAAMQIVNVDTLTIASDGRGGTFDMEGSRDFLFLSGGTQRLIIKGINGNVGVGAMFDPDAKLAIVNDDAKNSVHITSTDTQIDDRVGLVIDGPGVPIGFVSQALVANSGTGAGDNYAARFGGKVVISSSAASSGGASLLTVDQGGVSIGYPTELAPDGGLLASGNVGIGTTTFGPTDKLRVEGGQSLFSSMGLGALSAIVGAGERVGITGISGLADGTNPDEAGVLGIGTWNGIVARGTKFDFFADGVGDDYGTSSSIRWKKNIQPIDNILGKISAIRGVYFDWDEAHGGKHDLGMIAEEVGEQFPEIVVYEDDGKYAIGMDYGKLTTVLVEAVKEQQKQIEELKKEIELLKKNRQRVK